MNIPLDTDHTMTRLTLFLSAALHVLPINAFAHGFTIGDIEIGHPFARATPHGAVTGAAYLKLTNRGDTADRLVSASGEVARQIEIHESNIEQSIVSMRPVADGIHIAAGETVELVPGGYHLMLIGLSRPLAEGEKVPVTLTFEKAGEIEVELAIEASVPANSEDPHANH